MRMIINWPILALSTLPLILSPGTKADQPPVSWSQTSVAKVLVPGQSRVVSINFQVTSILTNADVVLVPELQPVLQVTPASFALLKPGTSYSVSLAIDIPPGTPIGTLLDGTIHLVIGAQTVPQTLKVEIEIEGSSFERPDPTKLFADPDGSTYPLNQAIIILDRSEGLATATQIAQSFGGSIVGLIPTANAYQLALPTSSQSELENVLTSLEGDPRVLNVLKNILGTFFGATDLANLAACSPDHPEYVRAYKNVRLLEAYDFLSMQPLSFSSVSIGMVDTGIDREHVEFIGVDAGAESITSPEDLDGHGTSVSGIIGANNLGLINSCVGSNGLRQTEMNGIVSGLPIPYSLRMRGFGLLTVFELSSDLDALGAAGIPIVNVSVGVNSGFSILFGGFNRLTDLFRRIISSHPATLFVIAAGEDDLDATNVTPANLGGPGGLQNVITTAATNPIDDSRANTPTLSQAGPSNWGSHIDIAAPGQNVYAPTINQSLFSTFPYLIVSLDPAYQLFNGTSASAPIVAGAAVILKALEGATGKKLSPGQIKQILITSGDAITTDKPIGGHRLDVCRAVKAALNTPDPPAPQLLSPTNNAVIPLNTSTSSGSQYNVFFSWSDVSAEACNGRSGYFIQIYNNGQFFSGASVFQATGFNLTISNPASLTGWTWTVTTVDEFGNRTQSAVGTFSLQSQGGGIPPGPCPIAVMYPTVNITVYDQSRTNVHPFLCSWLQFFAFTYHDSAWMQANGKILGPPPGGPGTGTVGDGFCDNSPSGSVGSCGPVPLEGCGNAAADCGSCPTIINIADVNIANSSNACDPSQCSGGNCSSLTCNTGSSSGCFFACGSCHYGGEVNPATCTGQSVAVDFASPANSQLCSQIAATAQQCGATFVSYQHDLPNTLHVSAGGPAAGCECPTVDSGSGVPCP